VGAIYFLISGLILQLRRPALANADVR
jgi:hypothetical protein